MRALTALLVCLSVMFALHLSDSYRIKSTSEPDFECGFCARTRLIGCFNGKCTYRCYRSCNNGTYSFIEAHKFVIVGTK